MSAVAASPSPPAGEPPEDLVVRLAPDVLVRRGGRLLIGGSPSRLITLTAAGAAVVARWRGGGGIAGAERAARSLARRLLDAGILVPEPDSTDTAGLAVVVPVHGREEQLDRCLTAIRSAAPDASLLVVDDGSPDASAIARIAAAHAARITHHPSRLGPAAARNTGVAHTAEALVAFVDSDVLVDPACLARLTGHFRDPAVGAAAPRVLAADTGPGVIAGYEARHSSLDMGARPARVAQGSAVPFVPATTLVVRRGAFAAFDETLQTGEDVDFVWRMSEAGWAVRYDPVATVRHEHRTAARELARRRFTYATSIGALAVRHPSALRASRLDLPTAIVALALLRRPGLALGLTAVATTRVRSALPRGVTNPNRLAVELSLRSLRGAMRGLAHAIRRPWWPLYALAALRDRRAAAILAAAWAVGVAEAKPNRAAHAALLIGDDAISGLGTWWSCLRHRTVLPLMPALHRRR